MKQKQADESLKSHHTHQALFSHTDWNNPISARKLWDKGLATLHDDQSPLTNIASLSK